MDLKSFLNADSSSDNRFSTAMAKILIADDEKPLRILTKAILEEMGMEVLVACDGQEAIDMAQEHKPDLIVTDLLMPNKNGFEVTKAIRSNPDLEGTPLIILSAMGDEYNKITGFNEGADDYVVKPFNVEELKARIKALLIRHERYYDEPAESEQPQDSPVLAEIASEISAVSTGSKNLDEALCGGIPCGANILVVGPLGSGKSHFSRKFLAEGIRKLEPTLLTTLDDDPERIRVELSRETGKALKPDDRSSGFCLIDVYSWSSLMPSEAEPYRVSGKLDLNKLSGVIADGSASIGQSIQRKNGGRRVIDSISSLFTQFDLATVQRFLNQIARTAVAFGNVTTLFIVEEGTVDDATLKAISYTMDGVIRFKEEDGSFLAKVQSMKWVSANRDWVDRAL